MKVKVLKPFREKETGSILRPNLIIYLEGERVEELTSTPEPFVEIIEGEVLIEDSLELPDFNKMTKENIIKFAKDVMDIELDKSMTKAEMIQIIEEG